MHFSHRNRTLILKNVVASSTSTQEQQIQSIGASRLLAQSLDNSGNQPSQDATSWVTKRDRHMQLINSTIFDKDTEARQKAIERTRRQKIFERDEREKQKITKYLRSLAAPIARSSLSTSSFPAANELTINGLRFQVCNNGGKLLKTSSA